MRAETLFVSLALAASPAWAEGTVAKCLRAPPSREKAYCLLMTDDRAAIPALRDLALRKLGDGGKWSIGVEQDFFYAAENAGVLAAKTSHEELLEYADSNSLGPQLFGVRALRHMLSILRMGYAKGGAADEQRHEAMTPVVARVCKAKLGAADEHLAEEALRCAAETHDEKLLRAVVAVALSSVPSRIRRVALETLGDLGASRNKAELAKLAPLLSEPLPKRWLNDDVGIKSEACELLARVVDATDRWAAEAAQAAISEIGDKNSQARDQCRRLAKRAGAADVEEPALKHNWYPDFPLEHCRVHAFGSAGSLELCARSLPAPEGRKFELTLRDPSKLEKSEHPLVARVELPTQPTEYLQYEMVAQHELSKSRFLLFVPILTGVPDRYSAGRALLYLFDAEAKTVSLATEAPPCPAGCSGQTVQLRYKPPSPEKTVLLLQTVNGETRTVTLSWDGETLKLPPREAEGR